MTDNFINDTKNDIFSLFNKTDLRELLFIIDSYYLEYRDFLNLPEDITFGVEIEYEGFLREKVDSFIRTNFTGWVSKSDGSLKSGGEITSPIMNDNYICWKELSQVCCFLDSKRADTYHNAGGHIHIGANILNDDINSWILFIKLYTLYENILFRFLYGDKLCGRRGIFKYAPPIAEKFYTSITSLEKAKTLKDVGISLPVHKHLALNLGNVDFYKSKFFSSSKRNTLEFRNPNASTKEVIWQNNINTFTKMLLTCNKLNVDEELLNYKLRNEFNLNMGNLFLYNEVCLKQVLEFVDIIFDNNLDKVYFLRQYLKNFESNMNGLVKIKAKKFIK